MRISIEHNEPLGVAKIDLLIGLLQSAKNGDVSVHLSHKTSICVDEEIPEKITATRKQVNLPYADIIDYLNVKTNRKFSANSEATRKLIKARWIDLNSKWDEMQKFDAFITVIDNKCTDWFGDPKMDVYLRPATLFGPKFESYLNERSQQDLVDQPFQALDALLENVK